MAITIEKIKENLDLGECVVTIRDGAEIIVENVNIGVVRNPNLTLDTVDLRERALRIVNHHRHAADRTDTILIDTGGIFGRVPGGYVVSKKTRRDGSYPGRVSNG